LGQIAERQIGEARHHELRRQGDASGKRDQSLGESEGVSG
jgi:hypothetical protein